MFTSKLEFTFGNRTISGPACIFLLRILEVNGLKTINVFQTSKTSSFLHHLYTTPRLPLRTPHPQQTVPPQKKKLKSLSQEVPHGKGRRSWAIVINKRLPWKVTYPSSPNHCMKNGCISPIVISYLSNILPCSTSITPWKINDWNLKILLFLKSGKSSEPFTSMIRFQKPFIFKGCFMVQTVHPGKLTTGTQKWRWMEDDFPMQIR